MGIVGDKISFYGVDEYADPNMLKNVRRDIDGEIDNLYLVAEDYGNVKNMLNEHIVPIQTKVVDIYDDKIKLEDDFEFKNYGYNVRIKNPDYNTYGKQFSEKGPYLTYAKRLIFAVVETDNNQTKSLTKEEQKYPLVRHTEENTVTYDTYTPLFYLEEDDSVEFRDRSMNFAPRSIQYSVSVEDYIETIYEVHGSSRLIEQAKIDKYLPIFYGPFPKPFLGMPTLEKSTKEE